MLRLNLVRVTVLTSLALLLAQPAQASEKVALAPHRVAATIARVEVLLEVGGELKLLDQGKSTALKMNVVGKMKYRERLLDAAIRPAKARSIRHYDVAEAQIRIEKGGETQTLRDDRRLIVAAPHGERTALFSAQGPLTREELDLVDVPLNSLLVDGLLPTTEVSVGDTWAHDEKLLAPLLGLDAINQSEVASALKEVTAQAARMEISGTVQGAIGGVACDLSIKGRYSYDRSSRRVTWVAMLIEEKRSIGHVAPGTDVTARLQMSLVPATSVPELGDAVVQGLATSAGPEQLVLQYRAREGGYGFTYDRRWQVMVDEPEHVALRLIDRGELVAQCNVKPLAAVQPGKHPTLEAFQAEIQRSLEAKFGQFLAASTSTSPRGDTVHRVVTSGSVQELPIQWIHYLVASPRGQVMAVAFSVEQDLVPRLDDADVAIVGGLEWLDTPRTAAAGATAR